MMLKKEVYRVWYKQKYFLIILAFFIVEIIGFCNDTYSFPWKSADETEYYLDYMENIQGPYETWKGQKIEKDLSDEAIMKVHYQAMNEINSNYQYVKENIENREFAVPNAVELYIMNLKVDWMFLIVITILCVQLVSTFYSSGTIHIIQTSRNGRKIIAATDTLILIVSILGIALMSMLIQIGIYGSKWGFSSIDISLESFVYFATSTKSISLYTAFICIFTIRTFAYLIFGLLVFGIVAIVKKSLACFTIGIGIIFFPYYIFNDEKTLNMLYRLCIPIGSLIGLNYFAGNTENIEGQIVFTEITVTEIIGILFMQFAVALLIWGIGVCVFNGKGINPIKYIKVVTVIMLIPLLVGCTSKSDTSEKMYGKNEIVDGYIKVDDHNIYDIVLDQTISVKQTVNDDTRILAVGAKELLVARSEVDGNTENAYSIELYNPKTNKRECKIRFGNNNDVDGLLGLDSLIDINMISGGSNAETNMGINESVVYEDGCLYYAYDNVIVKADCLENEYRIIYHTSYMNNPIIENECVYYLDSENQLVFYSFQEEKECVLLKNVQQIWKYGGNIYFVKTDAMGLYLYDNINNEKKIVSEKITPVKVVVNDSVIACQDFEGTINIIQLDDFDRNDFVNNSEIGELAGVDQNVVYFRVIRDDKITIDSIKY